MPVVRLSEGRDAIQAYVQAQTSQGQPHVLDLVTQDNRRVILLIGDLTEDEGMRVTPVDEWRAYDVMKHMSASLDRSRTRLETLTSGRPFENPVVIPGSSGSVDYGSFRELRSAYIDAMADIIEVLRGADPRRGSISQPTTLSTVRSTGWDGRRTPTTCTRTTTSANSRTSSKRFAVPEPSPQRAP